MSKVSVKISALVLALVMLASITLSSCSPVEYMHYYQSQTELAEAFNKKLMVPATAPEGYLLTIIEVVAEKYAILYYEGSGIALQFCAFKGQTDSKNPVYIENAYDGEETRTISGTSVHLIDLISANGSQLYNASFSKGGLNYIIDGATEEQITAIIDSMTAISDVTDGDAFRGYSRVYFENAGELEAAIGLSMPLPEEIPGGFKPVKYYSVGGNIGVIELSDGTETIRWIGSTNEAVYNYVNVYSGNADSYTETDDTLVITVENTIVNTGDTDSSADDTVYLATWFSDYFESARYFIEFPEGTTRDNFILYSEPFYSASVISPPIYVVDDGTSTEETTAESTDN